MRTKLQQVALITLGAILGVLITLRSTRKLFDTHRRCVQEFVDHPADRLCDLVTLRVVQTREPALQPLKTEDARKKEPALGNWSAEPGNNS